jgi:hypothetical protein
MASTGVARRLGRLALLALLAALLGVPVLLPVHDVAAAPDSADTMGVARIDGMAPSRAVGRPVAEPSLVCVAELPAGAVPAGTLSIALARLGEVPAGEITTRYVARRGAVGMRAPPRRQVAL